MNSKQIHEMLRRARRTDSPAARDWRLPIKRDSLRTRAAASVILASFLLSGAAPEGLGEFAIIVHPENPNSSLTKKELVDILKAAEQFWGPGARIELLLPKSKSEAKEFLLKEIYKKSEDDLKRYWVELVFQNKIPNVPRVLPSDAVTLAFVRKTREAIAIVGVDSLPQDPGVKVLAIDGLKPGDSEYFAKIRQKVSVLESPAATPASAPRDERSSPPASKDDLTLRLERLEARMGPQEESEDGDDRGYDIGPKLQIRGFSDVRFGGRDTDSADPAGDIRTDQFSLGQLDLLLTAQMADQLGLLSEIVFAPKSTGQQAGNVERIITKYDFNSKVNIQAGRFHTTLGYWNEAYHHGEWLQTTIGRPQIVAFSGDGGLLPIHLIGMALKARQDVGQFGLDWSLEVGNGRGATRGFDQLVGDGNDVKALNIALGISPEAVDGLRLGGGVYLDDIPSNASATAGPLHGSIEETILNGFVTYRTCDWEFLAEYFDIHHDEAGIDTDSGGWYFQVGRKLDRWEPYVRIEAVDVDDGSTFFENKEDLDRFAAGVRWDFSAWSALKLQFAHTDANAAPGGFDHDDDELVVQWASAF